MQEEPQAKEERISEDWYEEELEAKKRWLEEEHEKLVDHLIKTYPKQIRKNKKKQ